MFSQDNTCNVNQLIYIHTRDFHVVRRRRRLWAKTVPIGINVWTFGLQIPLYMDNNFKQECVNKQFAALLLEENSK